jgi:hypothetical protein
MNSKILPIPDTHDDEEGEGRSLIIKLPYADHKLGHMQFEFKPANSMVCHINIFGLSMVF